MLRNCFKVVVSVVFLCVLSQITAEEFTFKYQKGETYRILSSVDQDIYVNGKFHHHADIINRISVEVTDAFDGKGVHDALFITSEQSTSDGEQFYNWGEEYTSIFTRDEFGMYEIADKYFMPVVRNVPTFPDRDLEPGDKWTGKGVEAHDLRRSFGIEVPFTVDFNVKYTYEGPVTLDGVLLHKILAKYTMRYENANRPRDFTEDYPKKTVGHSEQVIYWNNERGSIQFYNEKYSITITTASGMEFEFVGTAEARVEDIVRANTAENLAKIEEHLDSLAVENTEVRSTDKGLTISIENIQFEAESAVLEESEKRKVQKIAEILKTFPTNDLLVGGYTALWGTETGRRQLSKERAEAVASYLVQLGVKDISHIFTQGYGADNPIATNDTPEGRARNRRVEITILDR